MTIIRADVGLFDDFSYAGHDVFITLVFKHFEHFHDSFWGDFDDLPATRQVRQFHGPVWLLLGSIEAQRDLHPRNLTTGAMKCLELISKQVNHGWTRIVTD
jgi:hypothetical protein